MSVRRSDLRRLNTNRSIVACRFDYADRYPEALADLSRWISEDRIVRRFHIIQGLENAPEALGLLFTGGNTGKLFASVISTRFPCSDPFNLPRVVHVSGPETKTSKV